MRPPSCAPVGLRAYHVDDEPAFVRAYRDAGAEVRDDESALLVAFAERRRGAARHRALVERVDEAAALYLRRARDLPRSISGAPETRATAESSSTDTGSTI